MNKQERSRYSNLLYQSLAENALDVAPDIPAAHRALFQIDTQTDEYYRTLYTEQIGVKTGEQKKRPGNETCKYCERFHLQSLKTIDKDKDIVLGKTLEETFKSFVQRELQKRNFGIICISADTENLHMPDMKILSVDTGNPVLYFEFKAIFRPFIKISDKVNSKFECYSNSLTLDLSNGKKLANQRSLVENELGTDNVLYVYWYDLPCVNGMCQGL